MSVFSRKHQMQQKERPARTLDEVLRRQPTLVNLGARGAEGLRLPYDQRVADQLAAGLARRYANS